MKKGLITRLIAGQYTLIDLATNEVFDAKARGKLRYMRVLADSSFNVSTSAKTKKEAQTVMISPKVGDHVLYELIDDQITIQEVYPRTNDIKRPDVANVDQVLLLFSAVEPAFSFNLLDKFLIVLGQQKLKPILVVTKIDKASHLILEDLKIKLNYYEQIGFNVYYVNSKQKIGFDTLEHIFKDKITVLAGQTGVGKSTLLNALIPELNLRTQVISKALGRGKHTTRHSELYMFNEGFIADTPGFSKLDFEIKDASEIKAYYPDYVKLESDCKFGHSCMHLNEPGCRVKAQLKSDIEKERYENYVKFCLEVKNQKKKY